MSLVAVGTMAYDSLESPFGKVDRILGGSATYISLAASYFIRPIKAISIVGNDFEKEHVSLLESHGTILEGVEFREDEKSFFWAGRYHQDLNTRDTLTTDLNVLALFDPVVPNSYKDCEFLMLGNLDPSIQLKVIDQLDRRPKLIAMDTMNFWMDNTLETLNKVLTKVDLLIINDEEARQLSGEYSLVKAAKKIFTMGPKYLIIKKGEHGALLFGEGKIFSAPGLPLEEVFDPTGAGDSFAGGFMGYIAKTKDVSFDSMKRAIIHGSAMASFCVEKFGPERLKDLSETEIRDRLDAFSSLAAFDL